MTSNQSISFSPQKSHQLAQEVVTFKPIPTVDFNVVKNSMASKVKRLGSLLVRNKSRPWATDRLTITSSTSALSLLSTTTDDDSEEEHVATPNASTTEFKDILTIPNSNTVNQMNLDVVSVTPKDQSNQSSVVVVDTIEPSAKQQTRYKRRIVSSLEKRDPNNRKPLSDVFMVIHHLRMAFEEADSEIDQQIEYGHRQMLNSIIITPFTLC
ncbi:hypothetical protein BD408DRAFT_411144 [Parasitella parasitica]|nr:hypothetical protein BD408DRAFT_411144 [Parasitella parasitica]